MIRLAAIYFSVVFVAGFLLGTLRIIFVVPLVGTRSAELIEIPLMLLVIYFVGRRVAQWSSSRQHAFWIGVIALAMLLGAELLLATVLFRKSPFEALFNKDSVSGTAYYVSLIAFAVLPAWVRGSMAAQERNVKGNP